MSLLNELPSIYTIPYHRTFPSRLNFISYHYYVSILMDIMLI